jgi:hypothetical protein
MESMITIELNTRHNRVDIAEYCHANIGPRQYWLPNQIGGEKWRISSEVKPINPAGNWKIQKTYWYLELSNEQDAVGYILKYM